MSRIAIIGGGISGIAAAYYCNRKGIGADIFEAGATIGGRIGSERLGERYVDFGGKNIGRKYRRFRSFVKHCGDMRFEDFGFNTSQIVDGRLIRIAKDRSLAFTLMNVAYLSGVRGFLKLFPLFRAVGSRYGEGVLNSDFFNRIAERYDRDPLSVFFGERCSKYVIRPLTVRMNGAEPEECFPGNFGSNLALALDSYEQLEEGMSGLLNAFLSRGKENRIFSCRKVERVVPGQDGSRVAIECRGENGRERYVYDRVLVALPAVQAVPLFESSIPELAALLGRIQYYPVAVAVVRYGGDVFRSDQRAMVFDRTSPLSNAGAYGRNDLDLVRYTLSGVTARRIIAPETPPEEAVGIAENITAPYFRLKGNRREGFVYKYLDPGLCAYSSYHYKTIQTIGNVLDGYPGIGMTGDYWRGASIEACFRAAEESLEKMVSSVPGE
ncbi:amine oxidase [Prosthecochloris sp. GSB1]|uniref:FAD-dependent oxidoreductase n=1 Tax=Prosthecochloris sp. GSB1 TaxID=281093 RepID=UPI000B8C827C|nr:FAD-dependent oxidoreductase [Prosthecochloris sp. GSB1]ASQ90123.1 amine oxidase [Prosthecochloris sp. GSB1]